MVGEVDLPPTVLQAINWNQSLLLQLLLFFFFFFLSLDTAGRSELEGRKEVFCGASEECSSGGWLTVIDDDDDTTTSMVFSQHTHTHPPASAAKG